MKILAVTACPSGVAHTYMAAESLERKAKEMGISLKVEKNGASGIKMHLQQKKSSMLNASSSLLTAKLKWLVLIASQ